MIGRLAKVAAKLLDVLNRVTEVLTYLLVGYNKMEEKKAEIDEKLPDYARYIIIGVLTAGVALILFLVIRAIVKKCKKCKENRLKKKLEKQLALEV
ncbi:MAG: hypothetical protein IJJ41_09930 [Clostridia bacterium]|nr:hypothetical protein [Clostridia bacterium]